MPVGKPITECLQALGILDQHPHARNESQWPQIAKDVNEAIAGFATSIEEESQAHGAGESLNKWVEERAAEWVDLHGGCWAVKYRSTLLPNAPELPRDKSIIVYWVQQYTLNKWDCAFRNRKKKEPSNPLPGLPSYSSTTTELAINDSSVDGLQPQTDDKLQAQASEAKSESHDPDEWDPYGDSEHATISPTSAAASVSDQSTVLSTSNAIVPYSGLTSQVNDPSQHSFSSMPAGNEFRSRTYAPVTVEAEMFARIIFLVSPSKDRDGLMRKTYARAMNLEEAQKADTFRVGVLERLSEMGEVVGSRKLVARPECMTMPFVVESEYDHHILLNTVRTWGESKAPNLCVVYISLEHEV